MSALVEVEGLRVRFGDDVDALRGVDLHLERGESLAVVGESGSGKSTLGLCLVGAVQPPDARGSVRIDGEQLLGAPPDILRGLRGAKVALALQDAPLNPLATVADQIGGPLRDHLGLRGPAVRRKAEELADDVLLDRALLDHYPHQLSGGERRRAALAMAVSLGPDLVILDEPTAALDSATSQELIGRVSSLASLRRFALIVLSHDFTAAAQMAVRTVVLYAGEIMEAGDTELVLGDPAHPYSWALVNAYPVMSTSKDLRPIRGLPPDPRNVPGGCPYHPRCTQAEAVCSASHPELRPSHQRLVACHFGGLKTLLAARGVAKTFRIGRTDVPALRNASLHVREGEAVGIVGPSGSGKSTLARILSGHLEPDRGEVLLEGVPIGPSWRRQDRRQRRRVQLILQDPWDAVSPRLIVEQVLAEALDGREGEAADGPAAIAHVLQTVGLPTSGGFLSARAHQLSGGQLQRVVLARALLATPKVLIADEPTALLDPSEQARLLLALRERQVEMGLGLVLVSHDLAVVRKVTDRIVVLDGGRVVEEGPSNVISSTPASPTTRRMLQAAPTFGPTRLASQPERLAEKRSTNG